jgi:hypothetical protein
MDEQLSETLAAEIAKKHEEAQQAALGAKERIHDALMLAADTGMLIHKASEQYKGATKEWIRQYVPTLSIEQAEIYLGIHKVRTKRQFIEADTRQLKLLGITGEDEEDDSARHTAQRANGNRWVKWASHIVYSFRTLEQERPIKQWEAFERKAVVDQLEPVVEIYLKAGGKL